VSKPRQGADPGVADVAALIGDPVRAAMLFAVLDGGELPASELAFRSGASAQSASAHLGKLVDGGLLTVKAAGRQRLFRIASAEVAHVMETLSTIAKPVRIVALGQSESMQRLREARSCYDHLAGRLGVSLTEHFVDREMLHLGDGSFDLTRPGMEFFVGLGVDVERARASRRSFARACIDWTERRPHLAGSLGASLLDLFFSRKWIARNKRDRSLSLTEEGRAQFSQWFDFRAEHA
jgi:DNA-binding transcriptional ArsR family regulator